MSTYNDCDIDDQWWKNTIIYIVYIPSFKDSNCDGVGDFQGLISKLNYFDYLKIETLLLSPFYPSPNKDNGYDISNFVEVDPMYGTLKDFDDFMVAAKAQGIQVMIDFVANHTSDEHEWFIKSVEKEEPYKDYYVWADGKEENGNIVPPNNWISVFGGSAWEWNKNRQQFYLHQFLKEQPDLNLRNPKVKEELENVLRFWLDRGIDGIRIDAVSHFFENEELLDEPVAYKTTAQPNEYDYLDHIYTKGVHENLQILQEWRELLDDYGCKTGKYKVLLTEGTETLDNNMFYYGSYGKALSNVPFNFELLKVTSWFTGYQLQKLIYSWTAAMPRGKIPNWILGNHDHPRLASNVGDNLAGFLMIQMLLPGIPMCYYGDELGMTDARINPEDMKDSFALRTKPENSRDPARTPMQWNEGPCAGFTTFSKPWLPVNENYTTVNVETLKAQPFSILNLFKSLVRLKKEPAFRHGRLEFPYVDGNVFGMARILENTTSYLVVFNMGNCCCILDFRCNAAYLPEMASLAVTNMNFTKNIYFSHLMHKTAVSEFDAPRLSLTDYKVGSIWEVDMSKLLLLPKQAAVISFIPMKK